MEASLFKMVRTVASAKNPEQGMKVVEANCGKEEADRLRNMQLKDLLTLTVSQVMELAELAK